MWGSFGTERGNEQIGGGMKTRIKFIRTLLAAIVTITLIGCGKASTDTAVSSRPANGFIVSVSCSKTDTMFSGTIVSDGHSQAISGTGSGTYQVDGRDIICSFKKASADGSISLAVSKAGEKQGGSSTFEKFGGVRAEIHRGLLKQTSLFTTF